VSRHREPTRSPKVKLHTNGHVTVSGLHYEDFRALLTQASLRWYDDEKKDPGGEHRGCSNPECRCGQNYHEKLRWLIDVLDKSIKNEIQKTHPSRAEAPLKERLKERKTERDHLRSIIDAALREKFGKAPE